MAELNVTPDAGQSSLRIVLADDHALVRGGLALLIDMAAPGSEVLQANSFSQVSEQLSQKKAVDLVLLDLMMPGMDGEATIRALCQSSPDVPVVVISVKEDIGSIRSMLSAGAMGYIPKTSSPDVTVSAIRLVLAGGVYVPPHILNEGPHSSSNDSALHGKVKQETDLTRRQIEVLEHIESGKSNKAIASEMGLTTGTVKMHVSAIFKKLGVANRTEAVNKFSKIKNGADPMQ